MSGLRFYPLARPWRRWIGTADLCYHDRVLADGPISYWRLGEPSGTTAADEQGVHAGEYFNGPTFGVTGALTADSDTAVTFPVDEYMEAASFTPPPTSAVSIELWLNSNGITVSDVGVAGWWDADDERAQIYWPATTELRVGIQTAAGTTTPLIVTGLDMFSTAGWHHVVATQDGSNTRLYVDGVLVGGPLARTYNGSTIADTFKVGEYGSGNFGSPASGISFDEVAVYDYELTAAQVARHYASRSFPCPPPAADQVHPAALALTLSRPTPSRIDQTVHPGAFALAFAEPAPRVDQSVSPAALALALQAVAFTRIDQDVRPDVHARSFVPVAPRIDQAVTPAAIAQALTVLAFVQLDQTVNPGAAARTLTPVGPSRMDQELRPGAFAATLVAIAPRIDQAVATAVIALTAVAVAPTRIDQEVRLGALALALGIVAPTVNVAGGTDQQVDVAAIALSLSPLAPASIDQVVSLTAIALAIAELGPDAISFPQSVSPAAIALVLAELAPRVDLEVRPAALARALALLSPARMDMTVPLINALLRFGLPVPSITGGTVSAPTITPDPWFRRQEIPGQSVPIEAWSLYTSLIARYGLAEGRQIYERMLHERKGPFQAGAKYDPDRGGPAKPAVPHIEIPKAKRN